MKLVTFAIEIMYCVITHGFPVYSVFYSVHSTSVLLPEVLRVLGLQI